MVSPPQERSRYHDRAHRPPDRRHSEARSKGSEGLRRRRRWLRVLPGRGRYQRSRLTCDRGRGRNRAPGVGCSKRRAGSDRAIGFMEGVPAAVERRLGLTLKLAFYVLTSWIGLLVFSFALGVAGYIIASVGTVFGAAIVANALSTRVFERLPVTAVGLGWHHCSARNV